MDQRLLVGVNDCSYDMNRNAVISFLRMPGDVGSVKTPNLRSALSRMADR